MYVIVDSNIPIAATNTNDPHSEECSALLKKLSADGYKVVAPVTQLWDLVAYNQHPEKSKGHAQNMDLAFIIEHHDVTHELFTTTYTEAMTAIKGPDRVFVSLAKHLGLPLLTNDAQVLKNSAALGVKAISAAEFLSSGA